MRVRLHRNLNAPNKAVEWSITPLAGIHKNRVVAYCDSASLSDVEFRAQAGGTRRIKESGVRSVVAWVVGELTAVHIVRFRRDVQFDLPNSDSDTAHLSRVTFNPFSGIPAFLVCNTDSQQIHHSPSAVLTATGACFAEDSKDTLATLSPACNV